MQNIGLLSNKIDIISTDHAPHLATEKENPYMQAPSGTPLVKHSLQEIMQKVKKGKLTVGQLVEKICNETSIF